MGVAPGRAGGTHLVVVEVEAVEVVELIEVSVGVVVVGRRHRRDGGPQPLGVPRVVGDELGLAAELGLHVVVGGGRRSAEVDRQPRLVRPPRVEPAAHDGDVAVPRVDQPAARHAADGARVAREDERRVGRRRQLRHVVGKVGVERKNAPPGDASPAGTLSAPGTCASANAAGSRTSSSRAPPACIRSCASGGASSATRGSSAAAPDASSSAAERRTRERVGIAGLSW